MRYSMRHQHTMVIGGTGMLREAVREEGPVELLVVWIHDEEGPVPLAIHDAAAEVGHPIRIVHVVDSAAAGPERSLEARSAKISVYPDVTYQQVVLGFHREPDGPRWLMDLEISSGVVTATESETSPYVVGQIRPWCLRP